jgi:hypothetical protein
LRLELGYGSIDSIIVFDTVMENIIEEEKKIMVFADTATSNKKSQAQKTL